MTRQEFIAFVRVARLAVVCTTNADGYPEAALVEIAATEDGQLVFNTKTDTRKVSNIGRSPRVAVVIGWSDDISIQVEGVAEIVAESTRAAYAETFLAQFPGSRALHKDFTLIRIVPDWLRHYDARPESFEVSEGMWSR